MSPETCWMGMGTASLAASFQPWSSVGRSRSGRVPEQALEGRGAWARSHGLGRDPTYAPARGWPGPLCCEHRMTHDSNIARLIDIMLECNQTITVDIPSDGDSLGK